MPSEFSPICRRVFDARELVAEFPPRFTHPNKQLVHHIACPPGSQPSGSITFSRWSAMPLPSHETEGSKLRTQVREDYFGYEPSANGVVEWYLNFAHHDLFCAYPGSLFAQDEMQVTEHPALGSLREALLVSDLQPLTVERGKPTPALIRGVERRCRVATDPNAALGRPHGLYGNNFARAKADAIEKATQAIVPPPISNILAMEAPPGGVGQYSPEDIEFILTTAYTGFNAARIESVYAWSALPEVVVHTGFWGCGAYGGNRVLMALLQLLAARMARIDCLVFHTGDAAGTRAFTQATETLERDFKPTASRSTEDVIAQLESLGFRWGVSDGN